MCEKRRRAYPEDNPASSIKWNALRWNEVNPRFSAWNTKLFYVYAFVFEDLGFKSAEILLCDRNLWMQHSAWCNYWNTLKQHDARQSQQRCWHISARQAGPAGVGEKARHRTQGGGGGSAAALGALIWKDLWSVSSLNVSQEETTKSGGKSKRPKNKRSK